MWRLAYGFVLWLPCACCAQLTGQFTNTFTTSPLLWDFSGTYGRDEPAIRTEHTLTHSFSGAIIGTSDVHYDDGATRFVATQPATGRVSGGATIPVRVNVTGSGEFNGTTLGHPISGPINGSIGLTLTELQLSGTESATLCLRGRGCRTVTTNVSFALPAGMDGAWSLVLDLTTTNRLVRGTAAITLSNGRMISFRARGRNVPTDGTSRLVLNGMGSAFGRRLLLRVNASGQVQTLKGQLFGQRLVFP